MLNESSLNKSQYSNSKKYEARIYLSRKFKTNPKSKYEWIFEHFPKKENLKVLELGCGTGLFWLANRSNIIKSWTVTLSDYSPGMLEAARKSLSRLSRGFNYEVVNAEDIKYPDNSFDIVLANNMLYHIQNRDAALSKIKDILKDNGVFIASTMGRNDLIELHQYLYDFLETKNIKFRFKEYSFSLDNGLDQLNRHFNSITLERHENKLVINEVDAIIDYYLSFNGIYDNALVLPEEHIADFKAYLNTILQKENAITTTKDEGIFICKNAP